MIRPRVETVLLALLFACGGPSPPERGPTSVLLPPATAAATQESSAEAPSTRDLVQTECAPARAPARGSDDEPSPDEDFAAGLTAVRQQRFDDALPLLRESYRARCTEHALFLIGVSLDKLGYLDDARRTLEHYQDTASSEIGQRRVILYLACLRRRQQDMTVDCMEDHFDAATVNHGDRLAERVVPGTVSGRPTRPPGDHGSRALPIPRPCPCR